MSGELAVALAAEQAAVYAYGVIGVHLTSDAEQTEARTAEQAHRDRRDALVLRMSALKVSPSAAPAAYELPFALTDRSTALKLAVQIEDGVAQAWRPVLPAFEDPDRTTALAAMTAAAVQATRWRKIAGVTPLTVAFPGKVT